MSVEDEHKRTFVYAESALAYIKRNVLPADPRSYEFWYTYSAGYNHGLNRAINDTLKLKGRINVDEMQAIYGQFIAPNKLGDKLDEVGDKVTQEVEDLVDALRMGADATSDYGSLLENAGEKLRKLKDPENLEVFVTHLVKSTHSAVASNRKLENQLLESKRQIEGLQSKLETIRYESLTDELTTLHNRKHFDKTLTRLINQTRSGGGSFALLMTDIDHFKKFNDTFGHQTGDQVLRLVALAVKQNVKKDDVPCRYGGEEFAILLPRAELKEAAEVAEKIRHSVMSKELVKRSTGENLGRITISIGIATFHTHDTAETLIGRADKALYGAKKAGRNTIKTAQDQGVFNVA